MLNISGMTEEEFEDKIALLENNLEAITTELANMKENKDLIIHEYPFVGINPSLRDVVVFTKPNTGFALNSKGFTKGHFSTTWIQQNFCPFSGTITVKDGSLVVHEND